MANIAFFGVGAMGVPMVRNLLKAGHVVRVCPHKSMEGPKAVEADGAIIAKSLEEAVRPAEFIISIVPADKEVEAVYMNPAMRDLVQPGTVIIEMTSSTPECVIALKDYYAAVPAHVIDAPVTGAVVGAVNGTLTVLGGGDPADFTKAEPVFKSIAKDVFQLGGVGDGKRIKALTNLLGATNMAAASEFYRLCLKLGLNMETVADILPAASGGSNIFNRKIRQMIKDDYKPNFTLALMRKDMGIGLEVAKGAGLGMPMAEYAYGLFKEAVAYDAEDCCAVSKIDTSGRKLG